jgi:hypothetical protein
MSMIDPRGQGGGPGGQDSLWCALCGAEYLQGVAVCAECLVTLVENPPLKSEDIGDEDGEQIAYEYEDLDATDRFAIDRVLADAGVVHAWEGTTLVVAPYDEHEVDQLLDGAADPVEGGPDVDDALLDDDAEQVVYDLADWDAERRTDLDGRLETEGIAHAFDETGDLVVLAADEERVDAIVDEIEFPDQLAADDTAGVGGLDAVEALGNLFVATDRLVHDPSDTEGTLAAVDSTRAMASMPTPFGFAPPTWNDLLAQAGELRALLETEAEVVDDEAVHDAASKLRSAIRPFI